MKILYIIPARGGSKGLPGKNIKLLGGYPLISYSLNYARLFANDDNICVTTDSKEIGQIAAHSGYNVSFYRPESLAGDGSGMYEVLMHALNLYEIKNGNYDAVILLQPTSPFRRKYFMDDMLKLFNREIDMVVSVSETKANPYFNMFEENELGFLEVCKKGKAVVRRQDAPTVYQYNGSLYIINTSSLKNYSSFKDFELVVKYVTPENYSIDIDSGLDWNIAEYILDSNLVITDGKY